MAEGSVREQRQQLDRQRFEAWQREQVPVQNAREILDPHNFMYSRAAKLVAERRQHGQPELETEFDPMSDLLGGARLAVAFEEEGRDSTEPRANHRRDIRTLFTEALLKGGHISEVEAILNENGEADLGELPHWHLFLRAAHIGDERARIAEIAEEFYAASLFQNLQFRDTHDLIAISPSRPEIKGDTLMVRRIWFEEDGASWKRKTEQLYMQGSHEGDLSQLLHELGIWDSSKPVATAVEILNQPLVIRRGQFGKDISGFAQMLDTITTERLNQSVFCGTPLPEQVDPQHYGDLLAVSRSREQSIEKHLNKMEQATLGMVRSQTLSFQEENQRFVDMFIGSLRDICKDHPEYAEAAFGTEAAGHYIASFEARQRGDIDTAEKEINHAFGLSTSADACEITLSVATGKLEVSAYASLQEKYGTAHLQKGACVACLKGNQTQQLGPCGFCNDCDRNDRLSPGYIADLMKQQKKAEGEETPLVAAKEIPTASAQKLKIRNGQMFEIGDQQLEFRHKLQIGGTTPTFKSSEGEEISGESARELYESLLVSQKMAS